MADIKMLHTKAVVVRQNVQVEEGVIDAVVGSTNVLDRMGDSISQDGWDLTSYKSNPVILWGHNVKEERPPIGKAIKVWLEGKQERSKKLMFQVKFDLQDSFAAEVFRKIKDGFVNTVSVGFLPTEWEDLEPNNPWGGRKYTKQELLELSFVPVPANPEAVVALRSFGETDKRFEPIEEKDAFPLVEDEKSEDEEENKEVIEENNEEASEEEVLLDTESSNNSSIEDSAEENTETAEKDATDEVVTPEDPKIEEPQEDTEEKDEEVISDEEKEDKSLSVEEIKGQDNKLTSKVKMMGTHIGQMDTIQKKMADDMDKSLEEVEEKELMMSDVKKMQSHVSEMSTLCDDMMGMMGESLEESENTDLEEDIKRSVIPYKDMGVAPESEGWDGPGEMAKCDIAGLKAISAWYDSENADNKSAYKLPHHQGGNGVEGHKAVWRGVAAAMAALLGARGGVEIPDVDKKGVYNHLKKHYAQFDKEAPEFKMIEDQVLAGFEEEILALTLDREEKHIVRLVKKVLDNQKEKKTEKTQNYSDKQIVQALEVLNSALAKFI